MDYIDFHKKLRSLEDKEYIECLLSYSLATVIAGIKPASTITLSKYGKNLYDKWNKYGRFFVGEINLEYIELRESNKFIIVMIYDKKQLQKLFSKDEYREFLIGIGYKDNNIDKYLSVLKERYSLYNCPHELGVFLGIPLDDVKVFMYSKDKKCLISGYWRVYNNYSKAKETFDLYDRVKQDTIKSILKGNKYKDVIYKLKHAY